jgi:hypothetical protein
MGEVEWLDEFYVDHFEHVRGMLATPVETIMSSAWHLCRTGDVPTEWRMISLHHVFDMARRHIIASRGILTEPGEPEKGKWLATAEGSRIDKVVVNEIEQLRNVCARMLLVE